MPSDVFRSEKFVKPPPLVAVDDLDGEVTHVGYDRNSEAVFVRYAEWSPSMVVCFYDVNIDEIDTTSKSIGQELRKVLEKHEKHYAIPLSVYKRCASEETIVTATSQSVFWH